MPCSAGLTLLLVAHVHIVGMDLPQETGSFPINLEYPAIVASGSSTETEVRWWYVCAAKEVEWRGSTAVRYVIQGMLTRPYTLECTQQAVVSLLCTDCA